ncbi:MAG TPA: Gfo/Idh/MocA family oxidoreductase [Phototrophicaceae bacterium]|nr:Gfo/Idh/MocA family oxidoreductase [Phototrophicaceae bacterium]
MAEKIRWGILGTGNIAHKFATGLCAADDAELVAVGSRTQEAADRFGDEFGAPRRHASYEALASDPGVDAIYISTPHPFHQPNTILCLENGKAVLCEKPFAINTGEAQTMIDLARSKHLFLMEAMWTRYTPVLVKVRELLDAGAIGDVRMLTADFGFRTDLNPKGRLFDLELGGGALLDVGIYPLSLASMIFGEPSKMVSVAHLGETGADEQNAILFQYPQGEIAMLSSATRTSMPQEAVIMGTQGTIRLPPEWWHPQSFTLARPNRAPETFALPFRANGYEYEAMEVGDCLRAGKLESDVMPLAETLTLMRQMDVIRAEWGLVYPVERA